MQSPALRPSLLSRTVYEPNQIRHRSRQSRRSAPLPYRRRSAQSRPRHSQRSQHPLPHKRLIRLPTHLLHNRPQQQSPHVRILPPRPRRKIQRLPGNHPQNLPRRSPRSHSRYHHILVPPRSRPIPSPGVLNQIPHRNRIQATVPPPRHKLRHYRPSRLIQPQPTLAHQNHRRRHRYRLRTARYREYSLDRCAAKTTRRHQFPIPDNRERPARNPVFRQNPSKCSLRRRAFAPIRQDSG